jgi:hypothetical protein
MTTPSTVRAAADSLRTNSPERLWGLSAASVYAALAARATGEPLLEQLTPHIRTEVLRTNDDRSRVDVRELHEWLLDELGLTREGVLTLLGSYVVSSSKPRPLVRSIAVARLPAVETALRSCREADDTVPRREFDSLFADDWDVSVIGPALASLGFVNVYPDSVDLQAGRIDRALEAQRGRTSVILADAYRVVCSNLTDIEDEDCLDDIIERVTGERPTDIQSSTRVAATLADGPHSAVDTEAFANALEDQRREYRRELDTLRSLLAPGAGSELTRADTDGPVTDTDVTDADGDGDGQFVIDVLATVDTHPEHTALDVTFLTTRLSATPYAIYQTFSGLPGVECTVRDDAVIEFGSVPASIDGEDRWEEYTRHLVDRCATVQRRIDSVTDVSISEHPDPVATEALVAEEYESLEDGAVAPTYFTYTLLDPSALGEETMDRYVGDSRGLGRERAQLRRWHETRPSGLRSYTAMTDKLFSLGVNRELDSKVLRIMTPFDDDTFNEYVSQIRSLLDQGFELRLLTRHTKERWEWSRLQQHLLSEINHHRDRVTLRTYSRFKEYRRVTPETDFTDLGEFGIHGKLQTIGGADGGAALLGSANFVENSYVWNPECGVYTERTPFVAAAIEFFDIVWDLASADELAFARLQELPDRQLVPTYYT